MTDELFSGYIVLELAALVVCGLAAHFAGGLGVAAVGGVTLAYFSACAYLEE